MELSKSNEVLEKEARVADLQKQIKKRTTTLKSLKTRLSNTETEVQETMQGFMRESMNRIDRLRKAQNELKETIEKALETKKLPKKVREALEQFQQEVLEMMGEVEQEMDDDWMEKMQEEAARQREEQAENEPELEDWEREAQREEVVDQRKIRKIYLKLSTHFHPDKAKDAKEAEAFHSLMLRINKAYKENDIHTLLEIEREYVSSEDLRKIDPNNISFDLLDETLDKLEAELEFIENQISRTSGQIKELRNSQAGELLTAKKRADRDGEDLLDEIIGEDEDEALGDLKVLIDAVKRTVKKRRVDTVIKEFLEPDPFLDMLQNLMGGGGSPFDFEEEEEEPQDPNELVRGQAVEIAEPFLLKGENDIYKLENASGKILNFSHVNPKTKLKHYDFILDKETLDRIPDEFATGLYHERFSPVIQADSEKVLIPMKIKSHSTLEEDQFHYRRLFFIHHPEWAHRPEVVSVFRKVFFHPKADNDEIRNWQRFFSTYLVERGKSFKVTRRYEASNKALQEFEYPVLQLYFDPERRRFRAHVQGPKRKMRFDLYKLRLVDPPKGHDWLDAFHFWDITPQFWMPAGNNPFFRFSL
ncbi:MAG: hypothetical protein AAF740_10595 [Bacteroidota bacterium]